MFERFTKDARAVVLGAVDHAERLHAETVEEQHVLLALLDREASRASFALMSLGLAERKESVRTGTGRCAASRRALPRRRGRALRAGHRRLGDRLPGRRGPWRGRAAVRRTGAGRGRGWWSGLVGGHRPFAQGAKDLLTESLRMALAQRDRYIGDEHLLLALAARPGVPAEVLADHGVTYASLRRVLYGGGGGQGGLRGRSRRPGRGVAGQAPAPGLAGRRSALCGVPQCCPYVRRRRRQVASGVAQLLLRHPVVAGRVADVVTEAVQEPVEVAGGVARGVLVGPGGFVVGGEVLGGDRVVGLPRAGPSTGTGPCLRPAPRSLSLVGRSRSPSRTPCRSPFRTRRIPWPVR